ncbi:type II toxin-antitoxin system HicB family antitoxin [Oscillatoria sp. HE19RPO]|uniref:type II toxin-antitoxin system HicB family antitoxin n=1 Tax=Oscillatoria sp. HE19RPO TaxID=2954806 RepID=UPI0020C26A21|nr:type II toxin-antitoxin system HicB family antitoxin [Oscillatoria sp. HE19RPO]
MTTDLLNIQVQKPAETSWNKINFTVLIAEQAEGGYQATVLGWPDCQGSGLTKEEAIANLNQALNTRLETTEIASLQIVNPNAEHPWMKLAGMHEENPLFDEVLASIETDRQQLDMEMEGYYQQLDREEEG